MCTNPISLAVKQVASYWLPYTTAIIFTVSGELMTYLGDRYLYNYNFPWALVSLLIVSIVAIRYGPGPAAMSLIISAIFADSFVPDLHISLVSPNQPVEKTIIHFFLFVFCGLVTIGYSYYSTIINKKLQNKRISLNTLVGMTLPDSLAAIPGYDRAFIYRPAFIEEEIGGDFYDIFPITKDQPYYGILIGDVMGKGPSAASHTMMMRYAVRAYANLDCSPARTVTRIDNLVEMKENFATASLFFAILISNTGELVYANAGHEPPIIRRVNGTIEQLEPTGPIIGTGDPFEYSERSTQFLPGDTILLVTDGVVEARNPNRQFLNPEGVVDLLNKYPQTTDATSIVRQLTNDLVKFTHNHLHDDIALLCLKRF